MNSNYRVRAALLLAWVCAFTFDVHAAVNSWSTQGPPGGTFRQVQASPAPNVFYAIYNRSLHRTSDGGVTWVTVREFDGQATSLALDPTDDDRIYVAVQEEGLYRSEDGGQTFAVVATPPPDRYIQSVAANATAVYYSSQGYVYRSLDRGQSWTERGLAAPWMSDLWVDRNDANIIYASYLDELARSTDGGVTWTEVTIAMYHGVDGLALMSPTQLVAATIYGLFISSDSGTSWTRAMTGTFGNVVADPATPGRAIAIHAASGRPLWLTTDYGATWSSFGPNVPGYRAGVAFDAQSSMRMVMVTDQRAMRTTDGAQTWTDATVHPIASSPEQIVTTSASNSKLYTYTSGGGLFTTRGDSGWQRLSLDSAPEIAGSERGLPTLSVVPGQPDSLYLAMYGNGLYHSTDGGNQWSLLSGDLIPLRTGAIAFDADDRNIMYAAVNSIPLDWIPPEGLYRSLDGGVTWSPYSTNLGGETYATDLQIDPADGSRMFLAAIAFDDPGRSGLWRSTDRGVTWSRLSVGPYNVRKFAIDPSNTSRLYAATQHGVQTSSDGGDSFALNSEFARLTGSREAMSVAIDPTVPSTIYALSQGEATQSLGRLTSSSQVLRSVDGGQTWETLRDANASPKWWATQLALDPNKPSLIYVAALDRGIAALEVAPDLSVQIGGHSGTRPLNEESSFTVRAVNNGPYAATAVLATVNLPAGLAGIAASADRGTCASGTVVTCTLPVLRVGEEINIVVRYTPTTAMMLPVTAMLAAHESDSSTADNSVDASAQAGSTPSPPASASGGSGGGGGGALNLAAVIGMLLLSVYRRKRRPVLM